MQKPTTEFFRSTQLAPSQDMEERLARSLYHKTSSDTSIHNMKEKTSYFKVEETKTN